MVHHTWYLSCLPSGTTFSTNLVTQVNQQYGISYITLVTLVGDIFIHDGKEMYPMRRPLKVRTSEARNRENTFILAICSDVN